MPGQAVVRRAAVLRWQRFRQQAGSVADLMGFHAQHKLLLMACSPAAYRSLGRVVGQTGRGDLERSLEAYGAAFVEAMACSITRPRHVNVLQHIAGYFKRTLPDADRKAIEAAIEDYQQARTPLGVPINLLASHAEGHGVEYLLQQVYLDCAPAGFRPSVRGSRDRA